METIKNFAVGFLVTFLALVAVTLGFLLWPVMVGITSVALFIAVVILFIMLGFYLVVLVGYVVRKGFK